MSEVPEFKGFDKPQGLCPRCDSWGHYGDEQGLRVKCPLGCENSFLATPKYLAMINAGTVAAIERRRLEAEARELPDGAESPPGGISRADVEAALGRKLP